MAQGATLRFDVKGQRGELPAIGFGTANLKGEVCERSVGFALQANYQMVDTALLYGNQEQVGRALRQSGRARSEIWVTSKVGFFPPGSDKLWMYSADNVKGDEPASIDKCLQQLGVDYVDLMLLHNPIASAAEYNAACLPHFFEHFNSTGSDLAVRPSHLPDGSCLRDLITTAKGMQAREARDLAASRSVRERSWRALEEAQRAGKCRYIGVSNYPVPLLEEMKEYASVMPAINQVELHPGCALPELVSYARQCDMAVIGYGTGTFVSITKSPLVTQLAEKHCVSKIQVVLRWMLQRGVVSIPRSTSKDHIHENLHITHFELSDDDMQELDGLDRAYPFYWDSRPTIDTL